MMWYAYSLLALCVVQCLGAPADNPTTQIPIIAQEDTYDDNGTHKFSYETGNGIKVEESSFTKIVPGLQSRSGGAEGGADGEKEDDSVLVLQGSFSYTAPDGTVITLRYIADENGFQPIGDHLPTPPPIPDYILKSLQSQPEGNELDNNNEAKKSN